MSKKFENLITLTQIQNGAPGATGAPGASTSTKFIYCVSDSEDITSLPALPEGGQTNTFWKEAPPLDELQPETMAEEEEPVPQPEEPGFEQPTEKINPAPRERYFVPPKPVNTPEPEQEESLVSRMQALCARIFGNHS